MNTLKFKRIIGNVHPVFSQQHSSRKIILIYRAVGNSPWAISPADFKQQIQWLKLHCKIVPLTQLLTSNKNQDVIEVALTFDDGYSCLYNKVLPILQDNDATVTVYINTGWMGDCEKSRKNSHPNLGHYPDETFLIWDEVKSLASRYQDFDFSKQDEALYFVNKKVIKFFSEAKNAEQRVQKTKLNPIAFPSVTDYTGQFYAYEFQAGNTLYQENNPCIFQMLLRWLDEKLWVKKTVDPVVMKTACMKFYKEKTLKRLEQYHKKYPGEEQESQINGVIIPEVNDLLAQIPWDILTKGIPCFMHGDLHFDHAIYNSENKSFKLIDWRQDFGGHVEFGDVYYDLAKMYGGIILNYDYIKLNLFDYTEDENGIFFDFAQRFQASNYLKILTQYIKSKGYDLNKVRILVSLIYLNMSPLHHYPFDKMLYALGREMLYQELSKIVSTKNESGLVIS
ncbi:MAG: polysaccharide deacetylase family protein [Gammaproteobacteria bacterium]|nr:polysaccharide deacetylase family protein [Gammaproteobacteria bacterium]